ncbi:hypothetical protein LINGRAHAP2_LOCUS15106 [Linum grandiflorum]
MRLKDTDVDTAYYIFADGLPADETMVMKHGLTPEKAYHYYGNNFLLQAQKATKVSTKHLNDCMRVRLFFTTYF